MSAWTEANADAAQIERERWDALTPEQQAEAIEQHEDWLRETHPDVYYAVPASGPVDTWGDDELPPPDEIEWAMQSDAISDAGEYGRAA